MGIEMKSVNIPEQGLSKGLAESQAKINKLLRDMNEITLEQIKDEEIQDKLLQLNEQVYQELRRLVSDHSSKAIAIKNILGGQL